MKRLTKIVATIGPSCESPEVLEQLIKAGVNVFRFNFKHNDVAWHGNMIERVDKVAQSLNVTIGILLDLQGPEIRSLMSVPQIELKVGDVLKLGDKLDEADPYLITMTHSETVGYLTDGQQVIMDDGNFEFEFQNQNGVSVLISKSEGILKTRRTINIPGAEFPLPVLIKRDLEGLELAKRKEIDFLALSFVRSEHDLEVLRTKMVELSINAKVIAKIETAQSLDRLEQIIDQSDGIMIARGDLGVELPYEQVPYYQKQMTKQAIEQGKFVITATQMLETMIEKPHPTRAEISDVANATYDRSDAVMLSGETASGKYPVKAVETMRRTITFNERKFIVDSNLRYDYHISGITALVVESAYDLYLASKKQDSKYQVDAFVVMSKTGFAASLISTLRPDVPIFAFCTNPKVMSRLSINFGVYPQLVPIETSTRKLVTIKDVRACLDYLTEQGHLSHESNVIVVHGNYWDKPGKTSTVKLVSADMEK